jgi:hypothetical protein
VNLDSRSVGTRQGGEAYPGVRHGIGGGFGLLPQSKAVGVSVRVSVGVGVGEGIISRGVAMECIAVGVAMGVRVSRVDMIVVGSVDVRGVDMRVVDAVVTMSVLVTVAM